MDLKAEIAHMQQLRHPNVVQVFGISASSVSSKLFYLLEYMEGGSLESYMIKQRSNERHVSAKNVIRMARQFAAVNILSRSLASAPTFPHCCPPIFTVRVHWYLGYVLSARGGHYAPRLEACQSVAGRRQES
jgi:serine/threonine protein kinase